MNVHLGDLEDGVDGNDLMTLLRIFKGNFHIFPWEVREAARTVLGQGGIQFTQFFACLVAGQRGKRLKAK